MDANRFYSLSRSLIAAPSRRAMLGGTLGGTLGSLLHLAGSEGKGEKKKGKKCKGAANCPGGTKNCGGACVPHDACCPSCTTGFTCLSNGSCGHACAGTCPATCGACNSNAEGQAFCIAPGDCQKVGQACASTAECPQGQQCQLIGSCGFSDLRCVPLCTS